MSSGLMCAWDQVRLPCIFGNFHKGESKCHGMECSDCKAQDAETCGFSFLGKL